MRQTLQEGTARILVIDDEESVRKGLISILIREGHIAEGASSAEDGLAAAERNRYDLVFLDVRLPGTDGIGLIPRIRSKSNPPEVVVLTGYGSVPSAVEAMKRGALDYVEKPFHTDRILSLVRRVLEINYLKEEVDRLRGQVRQLTAPRIVGQSRAILGVLAAVDRVALSPTTTVLVRGESGTGKELVARAIHDRSARHDRPFIAVNCASFTESLLETELFGYEPGSFTGASGEGKEGLLAAAQTGTLFLDEISEMSTILQAKLLRVLQERSYRKVGGVEDIPLDVRIIASTNRDLERMVKEGLFREDLFYRLAVMPIRVPPLRERREDIPLLAHHFLAQFASQMGKLLRGFSEEAMENLTERHWPGNVRELRNAVEFAAITCPGGEIQEEHLPEAREPGITLSRAEDVLVLPGSDRSIRAMEEILIRRVLEETGWNISRSATILGINRTTLYNKIRLYNLDRDKSEKAPRPPAKISPPGRDVTLPAMPPRLSSPRVP